MIMPDGFTGCLFALESIYDIRILLNGPGGCRNRHTVLMRQLFNRPDSNPLIANLPYFNGQPRMPCTYMDEDDFINGTYDKLVDALLVIKEACNDTVAIVDSPGSALIGDNHNKAIADAGMSDRAFAVEATMISKPFSESYDLSLKMVMEHYSFDKLPTVSGTVNILGLPITERDWKHGLEELKELLSLMGLTVTASIGCGCTLEDLKASTSAECNVVIYPEYCKSLAGLMKDKYGIEAVGSDYGAPIGLESLESWIRNIAEATGRDPAPALAKIQQTRRILFEAISSDKTKSKKLEGLLFHIEGIPSKVYPLVRWLYGFLGMVPESIILDGSGDLEKDLEEYLESKGLESVLGQPLPEFTDVVLTNGHDANHLLEIRRCCASVDISFPSFEELILLPKPVLGCTGCLYVLEKIFNGL